MTATHNTKSTASCAPVLYLALDLGGSHWKLAFTVGLGQKPRLKTIAARSTPSLVLEIKAQPFQVWGVVIEGCNP